MRLGGTLESRSDSSSSQTSPLHSPQPRPSQPRPSQPRPSQPRPLPQPTLLPQYNGPIVLCLVFCSVVQARDCLRSPYQTGVECGKSDKQHCPTERQEKRRQNLRLGQWVSFWEDSWPQRAKTPFFLPFPFPPNFHPSSSFSQIDAFCNKNGEKREEIITAFLRLPSKGETGDMRRLPPWLEPW